MKFRDRFPAFLANRTNLFWRVWLPLGALMTGITLVAVIVGIGLHYREISEFNRVEANIVRTPIDVDPRVLARYPGTYQLTPTFDVEVTLVAGEIFAQGSGQSKVRFYPATESIFFNEVTPLLIRFERGDDGRVTHFHALEPGRNRQARRIH